MDGVTVCRSGYQSVIRSYIHTVIPSHGRKGENNKVGFGIVGKVSTTSANSQVHKADSIAEPIRHGQTADTPQGIYEENAVIY